MVRTPLKKRLQLYVLSHKLQAVPGFLWVQDNGPYLASFASLVILMIVVMDVETIESCEP